MGEADLWLARIKPMAWTDLGAQFCFVLGFGVLFGLAFVPPAPVGKPFYRMMASTAALSLAAGALMPPLAKALAWSDPGVLVGGLSVIGAISCTRQARGMLWYLGLGVSLVAAAAAAALTLERGLGLGLFGLPTLSTLATGTVAGSVGLAMVLGHWYLTVPKLDVAHLVRLNRVCVWVMLVNALLVFAVCLVNKAELELADARPLFGPWGAFFLGTRLIVGLLLPLLFAYMTQGSLRLGNTRSATGILYASTVLVLIGAAISISLQDTYRFPL